MSCPTTWMRSPADQNPVTADHVSRMLEDRLDVFLNTKKCQHRDAHTSLNEKIGTEIKWGFASAGGGFRHAHPDNLRVMLAEYPANLDHLPTERHALESVRAGDFQFVA